MSDGLVRPFEDISKMSTKILVVDPSQMYRDTLKVKYPDSAGFPRFDIAKFYLQRERDNIGLVITELESMGNGGSDVRKLLEAVRSGEGYMPIIARTNISLRGSMILVNEFDIDALFKKEGETGSTGDLYACIDDLLQNPEKYSGRPFISYPIPKYLSRPGMRNFTLTEANSRTKKFGKRKRR